MIKIGIVTLLYNNQNVGGVLQAYALQTFLKQNGFEAEQVLVSGKARPNINEYSIFEVISILYHRLIRKKHSPQDDLILKNRRLKYNAYIIRVLNPAAQVYNDETICSIEAQKDIWITGSDQVWNPAWWNGAYLLEFTSTDKKIAYAASIGIDEISCRKLKRLQSAVKSIQFLSVRESSAALLLQSLCEKKSFIALDPTLLLSLEDWLDLCEPINIPKKYILYYFLGKDDVIIKKIKEMQQVFADHECIIVAGSIDAYYFLIDNGIINVLLDINPGNYLYLTNHADAVLTDSFHGCVFSLIFNKIFYYIDRTIDGKKNKNLRIETLLNHIGLSGRNAEWVNISKCDLDWININKSLLQASQDSKKWLLTSIESLCIGRSS